METMDIPNGVKIKVHTKIIEVEGPRGKLICNFKHLNLDFQLKDEATGQHKLKIEAWFGKRKTSAAIRTALSHVKNLIIGVTKGYRYKMRFVYAHFSINALITNGAKSIEIRNFLDEKKVRKVEMLDGVSILRSEKVKDELKERKREKRNLRAERDGWVPRLERESSSRREEEEEEKKCRI